MKRVLATICLLIILMSGLAVAEDNEAPRSLLREYRGDVKMPDGLYETYAELVKVMRGDHEQIKEFCLPHAITITTGGRPKEMREYGPMNLPFLMSGFHANILHLRKDSEDTYLIRTGSSYLYFVRTKTMGWKLYHYGDKPIA